MTKDEDFKLLRIQNCVLKVSIHCEGCKQKVKKLLQRVEGVCEVKVDAEQQKVAVSGTVDSATLIKKLVRAGKHAQLWSQKSNQNQSQNQKQNQNVKQMQKNVSNSSGNNRNIIINSCVKDDSNCKGQTQALVKGCEALKNRQKLPVFSSDESDCFYEDDDNDYDDEMNDLSFQLSLLRQQAIAANNAKKNVGAIASTSNGTKINNNVGNVNAGKKGNPNQNMGIKMNSGGVDQKNMAAIRMNNVLSGGGNTNANTGASELGNIMNLAGFHGNGPNLTNATTVLGGNSSVLGGVPVESNIGHQGLPASRLHTGQYPSTIMTNMNGYDHPASMMNMQNRPMMQQQSPPPQMLYQRSPHIPPSSGYYHGYVPAQYYPCKEHPNYHADQSSAGAATDMFSDENTNGCSIM